MGDIEFQTGYVKDQAKRLLWMQDRNSASPSYGCFHYSYWRDKTSEFADARYQEASAALGMLTHEGFGFSNDESLDNELRSSFAAGVYFWTTIQHKDGSFDEWYKHEHGFAATEFPLIAFGLAFCLLSQATDPLLLQSYKITAKKACKWLHEHDDYTKMNHEMAAAAALAINARLLSDPDMLSHAKLKHDKVLNRQQAEGWFNEINGMDLGYCSVLLDYAMLYQEYSQDLSGLDAMKKLFGFLVSHVHPDLTILEDAGICLNPYLSRLGTILLSKHDGRASWLRMEFESKSAGVDGIAPYLMDDLRLCRWSYLPLAASVFLKSVIPVPPVNPADGKFFSKKANLFSMRDQGKVVTVASCGGASVKGTFLANGSFRSVVDRGYQYKDNGKIYCSGGYDAQRQVQVEESSMRISTNLSPASFMFPGFISRLVLRSLGAIPGMHRWLRMGIDAFRKINKTALNQSAAPVASEKSKFKLERSVHFLPHGFVIEDEIMAEGSARIKLQELQVLFHVNHGGSINKLTSETRKNQDSKVVRIKKTVNYDGMVKLELLDSK